MSITTKSTQQHGFNHTMRLGWDSLFLQPIADVFGRLVIKQSFLQHIVSYIVSATESLQLTLCLAALSGNDFIGSVCAQRHIMKLILDRLLRQR